MRMPLSNALVKCPSKIPSIEKCELRGLFTKEKRWGMDLGLGRWAAI